MGLEPYLLTGSLKAILHQRLVRSADEKGRFPLAELLLPGGAFRKAVLARADADALFAAAKDDGMEPLIGAAKRAMEHGIITESGLNHALGKQGSS